MTNNELKKELQNIIDTTTELTLEKTVAHKLLNAEDSYAYLSDIIHHGCVSGTVSSLVHTSYAHEFFDQYYNYIQDVISEFEEQTGAPVSFTHDIKTKLSWFAFEQAARNLADKLGLEI